MTYLEQASFVTELINAVEQALPKIDNEEIKQLLTSKLETFQNNITIGWGVEDVLEYEMTRGTAEQLGMTDDDARAALNHIRDSHDCNYGVTWDSVESAVNDWIDNSK